jgi:hypothetical protein
LSSDATFTKSITIGNVTDAEGNNGMMRYNTSLKTFEGYADGQWGSLGGAIDKDRDTQIIVEQNADEDIIRFYTNSSQKMMISNSDTNNVAIGYGFNNPQATLDVAGNVNISGNANIGKTLKLTTNENENGEKGMIRYDGTSFKGYTNNKWVSLNSASDIFNAILAIPYKTEVFQVYKISGDYKGGNRAIGLDDPDTNIMNKFYNLQYQKLEAKVTFTQVEVIVDSLHMSKTKKFYIKILVDKVEQILTGSVTELSFTIPLNLMLN